MAETLDERPLVLLARCMSTIIAECSDLSYGIACTSEHALRTRYVKVKQGLRLSKISTPRSLIAIEEYTTSADVF